MKTIIKILAALFITQIFFTLLFNLNNFCLYDYGFICKNSLFSNLDMLFKYLQLLSIGLVVYFINSSIMFYFKHKLYFKYYLAVNIFISIFITLICFTEGIEYIDDFCPGLVECKLQYFDLLLVGFKVGAIVWIFYLCLYLIYSLFNKLINNKKSPYL